MTTFVTGEAPAAAPAAPVEPNASSAVAAALPTPVSGAPAAPPAAASTPQPPSASERPEGLPEGFNSWAEVATAYNTLKSTQSTPPAPQAPQPAQALEAATKAAGIDMAALDAELTKDGKLSDATYETLAKAGVSREFMDAHIAGQQAIADREVNTIMASVGGEEAFKQIQAWGRSNLPAAELKAFNDLVDSKAPVETVNLVLAGIKSRYEAANGSEPTLLNGQTASAGAAGFQSIAQMTAAMSDPRYAADPAYRAEIEGRIAVTTAF